VRAIVDAVDAAHSTAIVLWPQQCANPAERLMVALLLTVANRARCLDAYLALLAAARQGLILRTVLLVSYYTLGLRVAEQNFEL